ncbi:hypothetical protein ACTTAI_13400 [Rhodobacter capsulatus]|uniref:hypothetical protein n=1 Tax=Rhodobacter capsulatus TaxID=1061 RepID=UPI004026398C
MATQFSTDVRNAVLNAIETTIGTAPTLELRSGPPPANAAAADTGVLLASMTLPSDWMADAANGAKGLLGTWQDSAADAAGTVGHYRIKASGACRVQGTVTITGGGGDMTLDNPALTVGQVVTITGYNLLAGGA